MGQSRWMLIFACCQAVQLGCAMEMETEAGEDAVAATDSAIKASGTVSGPVMVTDNNGDGLPNHGDSITFNVSATGTSTPQVGLRCHQDGNWIYDGYVGYFPGYMFDPWFTLQSSYWVSGISASCTARLFYNDRRGRQIVLATL